jgi:hypothetical protein
MTILKKLLTAVLHPRHSGLWQAGVPTQQRPHDYNVHC